MAVWRLQVNTGGTNVADYCLKNHVAAMGWSLRELTQAERSGIHTFLDYCNLARTQYKSFDSVCRMVEDVKEGDLLWMRSRNEGKYYIARVKANSTWAFREDAVQIDAANQLTNIDWYPATDKADEESVPGAVATSFIMRSTIQRIKKNGVEAYSQMLYNRVHDSALQRTALCKQPRSGGTIKAAVHTATAQKRRLAALTIASTLIFVMSFLIICKGIAYSSPFCTSLNMLFLQFTNQHFNLCPCKKRCFYCRCPIKIPLQNCFYFIRRKRRQRLDIPIKFFRHNHSYTMIFFICHFCRRVYDNLSNRNNSSSFGIKKSIIPLAEAVDIPFCISICRYFVSKNHLGFICV
jgi:hypothetical protein